MVVKVVVRMIRGKLNSYVTCFNCGEKGHMSTECKMANSNGGNRTSGGGPSVVISEA